MRDKKGLGVEGTNFEPLGPKLAEKAATLGYTKRGKLGRDPDAISTDSEGDTEMSDSSDSSDDDDAVAEGADFVPLNIGKKVSQFPTAEDSSEDRESRTTANGVEPNPYFVVDTEPTPVALDGNGVVKKSKKRAKGEDGEGKKAKKAKKEKTAAPEFDESALAPEPTKPEINFNELEAKLQAEVEAGTKAQEASATELAEEKKSKKKRRRSSDGVEGIVEKKAKKEKSKKPKDDVDELAEVMKENRKKRKLGDAASGGEEGQEGNERNDGQKRKEAQSGYWFG